MVGGTRGKWQWSWAGLGCRVSGSGPSTSALLCTVAFFELGGDKRLQGEVSYYHLFHRRHGAIITREGIRIGGSPRREYVTRGHPTHSTGGHPKEDITPERIPWVIMPLPDSRNPFITHAMHLTRQF